MTKNTDIANYDTSLPVANIVATDTIVVGSNVIINTSVLSIGNTTANVVINSTSILVGGISPSLPVGTIIAMPTTVVPTGTLACDGSAISRTTYSNLAAILRKTATITVTIATPGVITWTDHGLSVNDPVKFLTTGALPTGITANTTYYVRTVTNTTAFQISTTAGGSASVNTSGSQSGVHTGVSVPWGDGDGSTTVNLPDFRGEFLRGIDLGRGVDTNRYMGNTQLDQMQGHIHPTYIGGYAGNPYGSAYASVAAYNYDPTTTGTPQSDGTNGTPRTGTETRPRNKPVLFCIKY